MARQSTWTNMRRNGLSCVYKGLLTEVGHQSGTPDQSKMLSAICLSLLVGVALGDNSKRVCTVFGTSMHGHGTYYGEGADSGNACGLNRPQPAIRDSPVFNGTVAINSPDYAASFGCGMCYRVVGKGKGNGISPIMGDFYVYGNNICPECQEGSLDFAKGGDGVWDIDIQPVQCPVGDLKIKYKYEGTNPYYIKIQTRNERVPINRFQIYENGAWQEADRSMGYWLYMPKSPPISSPLKVRYGSSVNGQVLEDTVEMLPAGETDGTGVQFTKDDSLPAAE